MKTYAYLIFPLCLMLPGCAGRLHTPPPATFSQPRENPLRHTLAIGRIPDRSFARYPLFITERELQTFLTEGFQKNRVFTRVFPVRAKKDEIPETIRKEAARRDADLILEGELLESKCRFSGRNILAVPMYILNALIFGFPLGFNIDAKTWEGHAEFSYVIRDLFTGEIRFSGTAEAHACKNFSRWDELTERQANKNFIRRQLTPLVIHNLTAEVLRDITLRFPSSSAPAEAVTPQ